jgi:hypothetical protein
MANRSLGTRATRLALCALYAIGLVHWGVFFDWGRLRLSAYDWPKEAFFLEVFQEAIRSGRLPYHVRISAPYAKEFPQLINYPEPTKGSSVVCRFLALPETILSPDIILLCFLRPGQFFFVHFLLLYTVGFLGSLGIRRRFGLSITPFAIFFILFNFNGYITSHLAVGHSMWGGYFLLPFFALFILEWMEQRYSFVAPLRIAFVLFVMLLQGSFHMVTWCWLLIVLIGLFNWRLWKQSVVILAGSGILSAHRLIPAAYAFWGFNQLVFLGGYQSIGDLFSAFLLIEEPSYPPPFLFWWEYDLYIGVLGVAWLAYFGLYQRFVRASIFEPCRFRSLDLPMLVVALFSLDSLYGWIYSLPIPLFNGERATARFMIIPVVLLFVIAAVRMQRTFEWRGRDPNRHRLFAIGLAVMFGCLMLHSYAWLIGRLEKQPGSMWHDRQTVEWIDAADPGYKVTVAASAMLSGLAFLAWFYGMFRFQLRLEPSRQ